PPRSSPLLPYTTLFRSGRRELVCFAGGWLALFVALVSPLHAWGAALFAAHMTQHEVLMLVAAPLLVLGRPVAPTLRALPAAWVRDRKSTRLNSSHQITS